ncbi:HAD-IA family hydrolase [Candidatus Saccharibacteria bacterium]|nr:HAD-IA family hydrolase [Candidatus Saccharibacteria bacterium]
MRAIIFDCFGVLLGNIYRERLVTLEQTDPELAQQVRDIHKASDRGFLTREESLARMAQILGMTPEALAEEEDRGEMRNEALIAFAHTLKPRYKLAMLSNVSSRDRLDTRFLPGELDELFDVVVASGDEGIVKPEAGIYQLTAERLGVAPEACLMVDDVREFCDGAERVGMKTIQFITTEQTIRDITLLIDADKGRE